MLLRKWRGGYKSPVLDSSNCCKNLAYAICKSQKDRVAMDRGNYCYFFLKLLISLYSVICYCMLNKTFETMYNSNFVMYACNLYMYASLCAGASIHIVVD